ncbi:MAG: divalent-cation tolerance protein CutA [Desulfobacterales bacterium]|nr:divalent-cation tolerance protein CutA [Desulfobacterales bacterium]
MKGYIQLFTTTEKKEDARKIAREVVRRRLAACVQIIGPVSSTYWWKEGIEEAEEWLCVVKSREELYEKLEKAIRDVHPYEVPEIQAMPVVKGSPYYLRWLDRETSEAF